MEVIINYMSSIGFISIILSSLCTILVKIETFEKNYNDKLIKMRLLGEFEKNVDEYKELRDKKEDSELVEEMKHKTPNKINEVCNKYNYWSHLTFNLNERLRNAFNFGIISLLFSLIFFLKINTDVQLINTILSGVKILGGYLIVYLLFNKVIPPLRDAHLNHPREIDSALRKMQDGEFEEWLG